jgi:hypothetical protein
MTINTTSTEERISISAPLAATLALVALLIATVSSAATSGLATSMSVFLAFVTTLAGAGTLVLRNSYHDQNSAENTVAFAAALVSACFGFVLFLTALALGA